MRNFTLILLSISLAVLACGCSTQFYRWEGAKIIQGQGGAVKETNGIDLWIEGTPPRPFYVLGVITDHRPGGPPSMAFRNTQVAAKAKAHGGDAVLLKCEESELMGFQSSGNSFTTGQVTSFGSTAYGYANTSSSGFSHAMKRRHTKYYVIKYCEQPPVEPPAPVKKR